MVRTIWALKVLKFREKTEGTEAPYDERCGDFYPGHAFYSCKNLSSSLYESGMGDNDYSWQVLIKMAEARFHNNHLAFPFLPGLVSNLFSVIHLF